MKQADALRIQAWLDGELTASEAESVALLIERDAEARALAAELRWTRTAVAGGELERKIPESREFYWSKIERSIRESEASRPVSAKRTGQVWWLRWLAPAGIAAALAMFLILPMLNQSNHEPWMSGAEIESPLNDVGSITFRSEAEGMTIVWINTH